MFQIGQKYPALYMKSWVMYVGNSSMKYFVARQHCKWNELFHVRGKTEHIQSLSLAD